jgi:hypothetical protein
MAKRARKGRSRKQELDWSESESTGGILIEEGSYRFKVGPAEFDENKSGDRTIKVEMVGQSGEAKKKTIPTWFNLEPQSLWRLRSLFEALEVDELPEGAEDALEVLEENEGKIIVGNVVDNDYGGKSRSQIRDFSPDEEEDDRSSRRRRKKKDDDDGKPSRRRKKNDDDDDDDDDGKKSSRSKKKGKKVSGDEVQEMDEDELADLVKEHKLDVDLDDYKSLRKKVAAVIGELEEKELLEE